MFRRHILSFQNYLKKKRIPAALVTGVSDMYYVTGVPCDSLVLMVRPSGRIVFVPRMLKEQAQKLLPSWESVMYQDLSEAVAGYLKKNNIKKLHIDKNSVTIAQAEKLKSRCRAFLVKESSLITYLRIIKDHDEMHALQTAGKKTARVFSNIPALLKEGRREIDVADDIYTLFIREGLKPAFETIVAFGRNTSEPHHYPGFARLKKPCPVMVDAGGAYKGYSADLTMTFYLGKIDEFYSKIYHLVQRAKHTAEMMVKPGIRSIDLDTAVRDVFTQARVDNYFIHSTGHGVGIDVHEAPRIGPDSTDVLQPGMVITIEPGLYFPNRFGIRIEDTLAVTKTGYKVLTRT